MPLSSVLTTAGGLVFTGDMEGHLFAYDADNGNSCGQFNAGSGVRGGPVSYASMASSTSSFRPASARTHRASGAHPQIKDLPGGAAPIGFTLNKATSA